jgi:hypothetical protein
VSYGELDQKAVLLGDHGARLTMLEANVKEIRADVKSILAAVERRKGSWWVLATLGGATVGAVELIEALKGFFHK